MRYTVCVCILLAFIWLANSGHYTALSLTLGAVSVAFVSWLTHTIRIIDKESQPIHLLTRLPAYYGWLLKKIIQGNLEVVSHIWRTPLSVTPRVAALPTAQHNDMGLVIYANAITLTPGTVTIDIQRNRVVVHTLNHSGLAELQTGAMDQRVTALEP